MAANDPVTQIRIYRAMKEALSSGSFPPGHRLEAPRLAQIYGASITPVRETLYRLVGESLVRLDEGGGFSVRPASVDTIRALYDAHLRLIHACLDPPRLNGLAEHPDEREDYAMRTLRIFQTLAGTSNNMVLSALYDGLSDKMAPLRAAESQVVAEAWRDITDLEQAIGRRDSAQLRRLLRRYHTKRVAMAVALHSCLLSQAIGA